MGRKTHGPYVIAAIELNDVQKVSDILSTKFRDKSKVKNFLVSEVRRLASEYTEIPLFLAASIDDPTILKYMVQKHDTNINHVHEYGFQKPRKRKTALLVAVRRGLYATVDAILNMNGDVNIQDHKGRTPLHHAIRRADYRMVKLLVSKGAQVSVPDASGNSPLHIATIFGHTELVKLLLRYGGDLYKKGQHGAIPIHMAAREGHTSIVRMLCEFWEISVDIKVPCYDELDKAPIHVAASQGNAETVYSLLEFCKADVNIRDSEGNTPIHYVVLQDYDQLGMKSKDDFTETVKVLLNYGAEVNMRNSRGETALHLAARSEFQKVVETLIIAGCDPMTEDNDKNKAIDLVADDDTVSKQSLKNAMADRERIMSEAYEVRARGFTTNIQRSGMAPSNRSQSIMNVTAMQNMSNPARYYQHSFGSQNFLAGGTMNQQSSYSSSNSSKRRSKESVLSGGPKLPPSMTNQFQAGRRAKSVEDLDQPSRMRPSKTDPRLLMPGVDRHHRGHRVRKGSYQESEATSFWSITPPGSVRDVNDVDSVSMVSERRRNKGSKQGMRMVPDTRLLESDEELDEYPKNKKTNKSKKSQEPMMFGRPAEPTDAYSMASEDYYLDDDESVDALEVDYPPQRSSDSKVSSKVPKNKQDQKPKGKHNLDSWLHEQAKLRMAKDKTHKSEPVAHSTPPTARNVRKVDKQQSESSSEVSETDSDSDTTAVAQSKPQTKPKPKPLPPPKPKDRNTSSSSNIPGSGTLSKGKTSANNSKQDLRQFGKENPSIDKVIQLEVDDEGLSGNTVIRVIPVNPPGQTRTHTIPQGSEASTFLSFHDDEPEEVNTSKKNTGRKKSTDQNIEPGMQKGQRKEGAAPPLKNKTKNSKEPQQQPVPVPRPRETKTEVTKTSNAIASNKSKKKMESDSESSSASSDDEPLEPLPAGKVANAKQLPGSFATNKQPLPSKTKLDSQPKKSTGLIFEKAAEPSMDNFQQNNLARVSVGDFAIPSKSTSNVSPLPAGKTNNESKSQKSSTIDSKSRTLNFSTSSDLSGDIQNPKQQLQQQPPQQPKYQQIFPQQKFQKSQPEQKTEPKSESESESEEEESDEDEADHRMSTGGHEMRTVTFNSDGNMPYTLVGGNVEGIFLHAIDRNSEASKRGLLSGDQILKVNRSAMFGKTKEEADHMLRSIVGPVTMVVCKQTSKCRAIVDKGGAGDFAYYKAHFAYDALKKGELSVREGDVFLVTDSLPEGFSGFWKVQKMNAKTEEQADGFVPNRSRADQILVKQRLLLGKTSADRRGGTFMRSFIRSKSTDRHSRGGGLETDDGAGSPDAMGDVVSYERVVQKPAEVKRPVVILGLFCDIVIGRLIKENPEVYEKPEVEAENAKDAENPVDLSAIRSSFSHGKHCLIILSPPSVEYLLQKTDLSPIVMYISPVSKAMVKGVKAKLAPHYKKDAGYMYDEASKFEKNYEALFTAKVDYTLDEWWIYNLKEAISKIQNQPTWRSASPGEIEAAAAGEMTKYFPGETIQLRGTGRQGRDKTSRISRTTDDLPTTQTNKMNNMRNGTNASRTLTEEDELDDAKRGAKNTKPAGNKNAFSVPRAKPRQTAVPNHETPL